LKTELFNPTPFEPWCTFVVFPYECSYDEEVECIRGDKEFTHGFYVNSLITGLITLSLLGLSLITIIIGACVGHRVRSLFRQTEMPNDESWEKKQRLLIMQALMYFFAFLITWVFVLAQLFNLINGAQQDTSMNAITVLYRIFYPLQGFFNAIIFFHHKVTNLRQCHESISLAKALYYIILHPKMKMTEMHLSGISIVKLDRQKKEENKNKKTEQVEQAGNSPDNDSNNNNNSPDDDDRKSGRIPFSEEISYMFDDACVWIHSESIEDNENDDDERLDVNEDEENIYDTLSVPISHDMSYMNSSFLAVSHVSEISSKELSPRRFMENQAKKEHENPVEDDIIMASVSKDMDDQISNHHSSEMRFIRSELSEDTGRE